MKIKTLLIKYKELLLYVLFGGLTTLVNFIVFWLLNKTAGDSAYLVHNVIAWVAAVVFAYLTNKLWVFESKSWKPAVVLKEIPEFVLARGFSLLVEEGGLWLFVEVLGIDKFSFSAFGFEITGKLVAKLILAVIVVVLNYFFSKFIIFAGKRKKKK